MKPLIVANWKCNPITLAEAKKRFFYLLKNGIKNIKKIEVVICPPFVYLTELEIKNNKSVIKLGAQDCFWEEKGAFTGEVSPVMLKNLGCDYVIIGHSERRKLLRETDEMINKKLKAAIKAKLKPILCIGETEKERKQGKTIKVLKYQLEKDLNHLTAQSLNGLILAYEPLWAIGTGNPCNFIDAKKVLLFLKRKLKQLPILYGGSVNSENAVDFIKKAGFNGLLVGSASLNPKEFLEIVKNVDLSFKQ